MAPAIWAGDSKGAKPQATVITPGHGLLDATIAVTLEDAGDVLKRGGILVYERILR